MINFIHIPKNGGSSIRTLIRQSNIQMKYFGHNVGKTFPKDNIFVIVREPIDRFCSSVCYTLTHKEKRKKLSTGKLLDPESWVKCMMDIEHPHRNILFDIFNNNENQLNPDLQLLYGEKIQYRYIYSPQCLWLIKQPRFILLFDDIQREFREFTNYIFKVKRNIILPHKNRSKNINNLSSKSTDFLTNFYRDDMKMYKSYARLPLKERINMNEKM